LPVEELEALYDIQIDEEDGSVWDTLEHRGFSSLSDWASYTESLEDDYDDQPAMGKKHYYDDDY
jgi:hypothetical protein